MIFIIHFYCFLKAAPCKELYFTSYVLCYCKKEKYARHQSCHLWIQDTNIPHCISVILIWFEENHLLTYVFDAAGVINLNFELPDYPLVGAWTLRVQARTQTEDKTIQVEHYFRPRFEVSHMCVCMCVCVCVCACVRVRVRARACVWSK